MKKLLSLIILMSCLSCQTSKETVDSIIINASVYTVNSNFDKAEAFAIKDGKFVDVGTNAEIQEKYTSETIIDAKGQTVVPGLIDAHCHFLGMGFNQQSVNLVGTKSFDEVVQRVVEFQKEKNLNYIVGRGWDQNDWDIKEFPNKAKLDSLFPNTPISLTRIDGHAILCNQAALDLGKVTVNSKIDGGEVVIENGKLSGVLIDNAENLVMNYWPKSSRQDVVNALLDRGLIEQVKKMGDKLSLALKKELGQHPNVGDIRGRGLFQGIELVEDRETKKPFAPSLAISKKIKDLTFKAGLICYPMSGTRDGINGDHILLAPPYIINDSQIDEVVGKLSLSISQLIN